MRQTFVASLIPALIAVTVPAQAYVVDFGQGPTAPTICTEDSAGLGSLVDCFDYAYVSQSFGDVAGVSDITYSAPRIDPAPSLRWWSTDYNNLHGVAWADGFDSDSRARIEIRALIPGGLVTLHSLDLGAYFNTTRGTSLNIYAIGGGSALFSYSGNVGNQPENTATPFAPNVSAVGGLWIEFQDSAYNVGIDNIHYSVTAVPEPTAAVLLALGLAGVGAAARRRRI